MDGGDLANWGNERERFERSGTGEGNTGHGGNRQREIGSMHRLTGDQNPKGRSYESSDKSGSIAKENQQRTCECKNAIYGTSGRKRIYYIESCMVDEAILLFDEARKKLNELLESATPKRDVAGGEQPRGIL